MFRRKPVIPITLIGPSGQVQREILVDSGADDTVFPMHLAASLGANLNLATPRNAAGVGNRQPVGLLYAPMILELRDAVEVCLWRAVVAFTTAKLQFSLFGFAGGIQFFRTILDEDANEILLEPKPHLPRTQAAIP